MSDDVTSIPIIDLTNDSEIDGEITTTQYRKSLRKAQINKIFSPPTETIDKDTTNPCISSPYHRDIGGVRVLLPVNPYRCQINVMSKVIRAIDNECQCLVESPTGTGKTLALLCASLAWQKREKDRITNSVIQGYQKHHPENQQSPSKPSTSKSSTSVTELSFTNKTFGEKSIYDDSVNNDGKPFLNRIQQQAGPSSEFSDGTSGDNLVKINKSKQAGNENISRPDDQAQAENTAQNNTINASLWHEENLNNTIEMCVSYRLPIIYYGARTHQQLQQVIAEFGKTVYSEYAKMTILSSRDHSCIRDFDNSQWESRNAMCLSCTKTGPSTDNSNKNGSNCRYFDSRKRLNRDTLPRVFDIEDLKKRGKELIACPYYASRELKGNADIVFCPYNFLIDPKIRNSMRIYLKDNIVIIDEGHNIEDICREAATFSFTIEDVQTALKELKNAMSFRFANNDTLSFIEYLSKTLEKWEQWFENQMPLLRNSPLSTCRTLVTYEWEMANFVETLDCNNIGKLQYQEFKKNVTELSNKLRNNPDALKQVTMKTETLLESLNTVLGYIFGSYMDSYVAILELEFKCGLFETNEWRSSPYDNVSNHKHLKLHLYCMNSAVIFSQLSTARSVVLASGTLTPITSLESELDTTFKMKAIEKHIIPKERVWVGTVGGVQCTAEALRESNTRRVLGRVLARVCDVTPHGVLCFLPSYYTLEALVREWRQCGLWNEILKSKQIFKEATNVGDQTRVMREYTCAAEGCGALLLAVYRGKAAEGVDFRDRQARAVVLVGVPYPNISSQAVAQKMKYNNRNKERANLLSGREWYSVQAFRALNQAVGRSVRHAADWGAVLLLDARYASTHYTDNLSDWARRYLGNNHHDINSLVNNPNGIKAFMEIMQQKELSPVPDDNQ